MTIRPAIRLRTLMLLVAATAIALAVGLRYLARPRPVGLASAGMRTWVRWSDGSVTEVPPGGPVVGNWRQGRWLLRVDWIDGSRTWYWNPTPPTSSPAAPRRKIRSRTRARRRRPRDRP